VAMAKKAANDVVAAAADKEAVDAATTKEAMDDVVAVAAKAAADKEVADVAAAKIHLIHLKPNSLLNQSSGPNDTSTVHRSEITIT
jgi:hypothetical protein